MSEQEKGGAAAFIASVNVQSTADEKAQNDHVELSQARALAIMEEFIEWSKSQPLMKTIHDGNVEENALGDTAGAMMVALARVTAKRKPAIADAIACSQQFASVFFTAYLADWSKV